VALSLALLAGFTLAGCGQGKGPRDATGRSGAPQGWVTHTDAAGVAIDAPPAWSFKVDPVPALVSPPILFALGTGTVPAGGDCAPTAAISSMPPDGALIALTEYAGRVPQPYTFPRRPESFQLGPPGGPFGCWGVKAKLIPFEDGGRYFQAVVVFGQDAPDLVRGEVRSSLDSLEVDPRPLAEQPAAKCGSGEWTACPEATWVYDVINAANVGHLGNRGDDAILGLHRKRSFALWTSPSTSEAPPGASCRTVGGLESCEIGGQIYVEVQGVRLWTEPAPSPYASLRTEAALPGNATLNRLTRAARSVPLAVADEAKR
jgi:hypothetical protein